MFGFILENVPAAEEPVPEFSYSSSEDEEFYDAEGEKESTARYVHHFSNQFIIQILYHRYCLPP